MKNLKLGKLPASYDRRDFLFKNYRKRVWPTRPKEFGHETMIRAWGVLGNDRVGNCIFAGGAHEQMIWAVEGGKYINFLDSGVIADYSAVTGYDPANPGTDRGTVVREALKYRRRIGLIDEVGIRHKIEAYVALDPGDPDDLLNALYLFGSVGIGLESPESATDQFNNNKSWTVVRRARIDGGHYVPIVAYRGNIYCVTWGRLHPITMEFYKKYCDEARVMLSPEMFWDGYTLEGFNIDQLRGDLAAL